MRNRLFKYIKSLYSLNTIPLVFTALILRVVISGASIGDAIVAASVCALLGYHLLLKSKRGEAPDIRLIRDVQQLKEVVSAFKLAGAAKRDLPGPNQRLF